MIALQRPLHTPMTNFGVRDLVDGLESQNITAVVTINRRQSQSPQGSQLPQASISITGRRVSTSSSGSQADSVERSKKKIHPKVRTGCDTCKRRKIKCDEGKPWCLRCVKSGRKCDGYHPPQIKLFEPLTKPSRLDVASEERSFEYYLKETAVRMAGYRPIQLPLSFWSELCPRMAENLPAVKYALIALGATSEKYEAKYLRKAPIEEVKARTVFALEQYTRALRQLSASIGSSAISTEATLICCLLLTSCDFWHTGLPITLDHSYAGLRICRTVQNSGQKLPLENALEVDSFKLFPAFVHLADCATISGDENDPEKSFLVSQFADNAELIAPSCFIDAHEAFAAMDRMIRQLAKIAPPGDPAEIRRLQSYLSDVIKALQENFTLAKDNGDAAATFAFRSMLVHHRVSCIMLNTMTAEDEFIFDNYVDDFDFIVSEVETLMKLRSADGSRLVENVRVWLGFIPPLFYTATKCRDSEIRHRAINALHLAPHTERMWTTCTASQIAQELVWLEESGIVHEECIDALCGPRISLLNIGFDIAQNKITLAYERQNVRGPKYATSTISWSKSGDLDAFYIPQAVEMPQKQVRVAGYAPIIMTFRGIDCHCGEYASPTEHSVLLRSNLD